MIRYALVCEGGHDFESWFPGSDAFEAQAARGLVTCPFCDSHKVERAIMAPAVARSDLARVAPVEASPASGGGGGAAPVTPQPPEPVALISEKEIALRAMIRQMREHVIQTAEHVGPRFAEEALKIHTGEIEHRSIYGEASPDDVEMLREEGVAFSTLPRLPDERN